MAAFDALPAPLRQWLSEAALPWSPASAQKIWSNARANGRSTEEALTSLNQIEARMLARDTESSIHQRN